MSEYYSPRPDLFKKATPAESAAFSRARLPVDVPFVGTLEEARTQLLRTETSGVILQRDPQAFAQVLADLTACELRAWGKYEARRFTGSDEKVLRAHIMKELSRIGVRKEFSESRDIITTDMIELNKFVQSMTKEDDLRSHVGSMWRDDRGFHIDIADNIGAFVSYIGPGCLVVGRDDVIYNSADAETAKRPLWLELKPGVIPYLTATFDVVFLKGRSDLTNVALENNVGLPHASPSPFDTAAGFDKRLSYIVYGTRFGEQFRP